MPEGPTPGSAADDVVPADPESVARAIVLRKLTAAPQTRSQLATALARRNVPDDVATRVLDRFEEVNLVDDEAYAASWVRARQRDRGLARRALTHELRRRGVADEVVAQAVAAVSADDELATAVSLVRRKQRSLAGLAPEVRTRRLMGMLARKGYSSGLAATAIREADPDVATAEVLDQAWSQDH